MAVPDSTTYRKNGKIRSDGSIASWTVPENQLNAVNQFGAGGRASQKTVVLHAKANSGADIRSYSWLSAQDQEIIQSGSYLSSLTIQRVKTGVEWVGYGEQERITHVYLA